MGGAASPVPPGPGLAVRLALVDVGALPDDRLMGFVHDQYRQLAYQQEQFWAALAEVARRPPLSVTADDSLTPEREFDLAAAEISAELLLSRFAAERELGFGVDLVGLPRVAAALRAGELDRVKAVVLVEAVRDLSDEHRSAILDEVLPTVSTVRVSQVKARVQRLAIALDPAWAERRYRRALKVQKVVHYLAEDGTVTVAADGLPAEQALPAMQRLSNLAHAAKRAGAAARVDQLRVALFCGLLDSRFTGLTETQIIADLVTQFPKPAEPAKPTDADAGADTEPAEPTADTDDEAAETAGPAGPAGGATAPLARRAPRPGSEPATDDHAEQPNGEPARVAGSGVELRVGLATLMGLVDEPGEVAGAGPVIAAVARDLALRQRRGEWRFVVVDERGEFVFEGLTRHRPQTMPAGGAKGGIVELHVPPSLLDPALAERHPAWAKLLTDLARQHARQAPIGQNPDARLPGRALRRRIQVTHRHCTFPGCRRPAAAAQTDHRHDWAKNGPTVEDNLQPACRYHHDLKTRWGWRLVKRDDHTYVWISPLNRKHPVRLEPIAKPLPPPLARPGQDADPPPAGQHRSAA